MQIGNCGSPLETSEGWLLLTHGVGPMRTYCIGAMLLDLDDPLKVIGVLDEPLITPTEKERDGYVPNVVYTCGAMIHNGARVHSVCDVGHDHAFCRGFPRSAAGSAGEVSAGNDARHAESQTVGIDRDVPSITQLHLGVRPHDVHLIVNAYDSRHHLDDLLQKLLQVERGKLPRHNDRLIDQCDGVLR